MSVPPIEDWLLPYTARLAPRPDDAVDLVVIHCTELPDMAMARAFGEQVRYPASGTGNSGHYYLDRDGRCWRFVEAARIAHHVSGWNERSVGIELVNRGRYPHWTDSRHQRFEEPYPPAQIQALTGLLRQLAAALPSLRWIAGHEDLDRRLEPASDDPAILLPRRRDPGPLFPWDAVLPAIPLERWHGDGAPLP
ncbi:N-acetylmuramoyl-L-alanine amidase [Dokdonella koreensis]|uniref:N-acetylmuramoyl-L-alanine amidase n=1 Tax=Dokdonella koreensis DS-123 TaxID=1300342 RepID=A0A160DTX9_9GAMM|nr:N-acetylmuramoyl-L-alanine amidase [Dokdonella koreensis]ANB17451.1 Putative N-acetylmuramoyl-l-alanine amidase protein [Dokdonella koreensis DS-123]